VPNKKFEIPPLLLPYFEELARLGVYGNEVGQVATFILRKEVMHLIETKVLDRIKIVAVATPTGDDESKP
jgi:hypothetical protein